MVYKACARRYTLKMNAWEEQQLAVLVDDGYEYGRRQLRRRKRDPLGMGITVFVWLLAVSFCCAACGVGFALLGLAFDVAGRWLYLFH